eukprot:12408926-Karenia_brevis.AAC.1
MHSEMCPLTRSAECGEMCAITPPFGYYFTLALLCSRILCCGILKLLMRRRQLSMRSGACKTKPGARGQGRTLGMDATDDEQGNDDEGNNDDDHYEDDADHHHHGEDGGEYDKYDNDHDVVGDDHGDN